jgi:hypothetical protein
MRDVLGLDLPAFKPYVAWEHAAKAGGFRVLHEKFCIVSDFPERLRVDAQNLPHCEDGPSHRWRDGTALYHWHGVRVPAHWIEARDTLTATEVLAVTQVEQRAAGLSIIGIAKALGHLNARVIDHDPDPAHGDLIEVTLPGVDGPARYLKAVCPRNGVIVEGVPHRYDDGTPIKTVQAAQAWRVGLHPTEFRFPERRT